MLWFVASSGCGTPAQADSVPPFDPGLHAVPSAHSFDEARIAPGGEDPGVPLRPSNGAEPDDAATTDAAGSAVPPVSPHPAPVGAILHAFQEPLPSRALPKDSAAMRYANLSVGQCRRELTKRKLALKRQGPSARGIAEEYRVSGPIGGITFVTPRAPSPYGLLDCRLGLVLDDLAKVLVQHGVQKVRIDNFYRSGARLPGSRKKSQHGYGLAIDLVSFIREDGTELRVEDDWGSGIGSEPCGPRAVLETPTVNSVPLRDLACAIARAGLFHHILTPGHDRAHRNHLHLDIKRGTKTLLLE
jgi:hypothetical protein